MGYCLTVREDLPTGGWQVVVRVGLTRAETNSLFLAGDHMVSWPLRGLRPARNRGPERSGMFISEIAARPEGLVLRYAERQQAESAARALRACFSAAGIAEEAE